MVPFGLPSEAPRRTGPGLRTSIDGIEDDDRVILWAGGVYNWFDPLVVIRAVGRLADRIGGVRLVFLGMQHPNAAIPKMRAATEARAVSDHLGLTDRVVFFNEGWVPYDQRAAFLLDANVGVSTHLDQIEARFSFRTRVLDYLWSGLPMVLTEGDVLAELVAAERLGQVVPAGDVTAVEAALEATLLSEPPSKSRFAAVTASMTWERVAQPLVDFCANPQRAPDLTARPARWSSSPWARPYVGRGTRNRLVRPRPGG